MESYRRKRAYAGPLRRLETQVRTAIANHLRRPADGIELNHSLRRDLGLDNLSLVGIALELEETLHGEFPFALLQDVDTVADLVRLHTRLVSELGKPGGALAATSLSWPRARQRAEAARRAVAPKRALQ